MADVPHDLLGQIKRLEELFTVPQDKLKEITDHFVGELKQGKVSSQCAGGLTDSIGRSDKGGWRYCEQSDILAPKAAY